MSIIEQTKDWAIGEETVRTTLYIDRQIRDSFGRTFVDINVNRPDLQYSPGEVPFRTIHDAIDHLAQQADGCCDQDLKQSIGGRALTAETYVRALSGEKFFFKDYVERTQGITPDWIDESKIAEYFTIADQIFSNLKPGYRLNREGWDNYYKVNKLSPRQDIEPAFRKAASRFRKPIANALGVEFDPNYLVKFVDEEANWINSMTTDETTHDLVLKVNTNESNATRWNLGGVGLLWLHEIAGHWLQAKQLEKGIKAGRVNPYYGLTTIPGGEQPFCEALAISYPVQMTEAYRLLTMEELAMYYLRISSEGVLNNAQLLANGLELNARDRAFDLIVDGLPQETDRNRIRRIVNNGVDDPRQRSYDQAYHAAGTRYHDYAGRTPSDKRLALVKSQYEKLLLPNDILSPIYKAA